MNLIAIASAVVGKDIPLTLLQSRILEGIIEKLSPDTRQALEYDSCATKTQGGAKEQAETRYHEAIGELRNNRMLYDVLLLSANNFNDLINICTASVIGQYQKQPAEPEQSHSPLFEEFLKANIYTDITNFDGIYYGYIGVHHKTSEWQRPLRLAPVYASILRQKEEKGENAHPVWLSTLYANKLAKNGIKTNGQLYERISEDLLAGQFGIGMRTIREIEKYMSFWTKDL